MIVIESVIRLSLYAGDVIWIRFIIPDSVEQIQTCVSRQTNKHACNGLTLGFIKNLIRYGESYLVNKQTEIIMAKLSSNFVLLSHMFYQYRHIIGFKFTYQTQTLVI